MIYTVELVLGVSNGQIFISIIIPTILSCMLLVIALGHGLSIGMLVDRTNFKPNQAIWRSARNSVILVLVSSLGFGLASTIVLNICNETLALINHSHFIGLSVQLFVFGLLVGPFFGLLFGLVYGGGMATIKHLVLRFMLWNNGYIPFNYIPFLDYASECILLRKIGGGYIFAHQLLQSYFVSLDSTPNPATESKQSQDRKQTP